MKKQKKRLGVLAVPLALASFAFSAGAAGPPLDSPPRGAKTITLIHVAGIHGNFMPRPNLRPLDTAEGMEGGLARLAAVIKQVRKREPQSVLVYDGDHMSTSAVSVYTRGQAMVDVLDTFGFDIYAPGNWDWIYGKERMVELFGNGRWGVVAANAYDEATGDRLFPAYRMIKVRGENVGFIGLTADRGLPAVPSSNEGLVFTEGFDEIELSIAELKAQGADMIVLASERGLAVNTLIADEFPDIDAVLSVDMHEETPEIALSEENGTPVSAVGWGGTRVGVLRMFMRRGEVVGHDYTWIPVTDQLPDPATAELVASVRAPFLNGPQFEEHVHPISGHVLDTPLDTVVGRVAQDFHRANFANGAAGRLSFPNAVLEGTSHNLFTDAFRTTANTDFAMIRGFRYGTYVAPGDITLGDLYSYLAAGAQIARGYVTGDEIRLWIERTISGVLNEDPRQWGGGWIFGFSGVSFNIEPMNAFGAQGVNVMVRRNASDAMEPLVEGDPDCTTTPEDLACYRVAGYWFPGYPKRIGAFRNAVNVEVLTPEARWVSAELVTDPNNTYEVKAPAEVVADYMPDYTPTLTSLGRVNLLTPFPAPVFGNPEIQPLRGVPGID